MLDSQRGREGEGCWENDTNQGLIHENILPHTTSNLMQRV